MAQIRTKAVNSRDTILQVSVRLFAELGFEGVAMRQVAAEAGVTLPTIYHFFKNKQELFNAVETELYSAHTASLLNALHADAPADKRLRDFICRLMISFEKHPAYFKILHRNLVEGRPANQEFLKESLQHVYDELKSLLNEYAPGTAGGVVPILIFSSIVGYETMRPAIETLKGYRYSDAPRERERKVLADAIMKMIGGLAR